MALESKQIQAIPLDTIGIDGIDTQTTATALGPNWFTKADNIVYTEGGKVAFRKGLKQKTLNGGAKVGSLVEHFDGTNHKVFAGVGTNMYEVDYQIKTMRGLTLLLLVLLLLIVSLVTLIMNYLYLSTIQTL